METPHCPEESPVDPPESLTTPVFDGSGTAFFRIWIVNLFLTIVTFGIYIPWAKVRTRRYFYHSTRLNGRAFDYTANPLKLLIGYLIVAAALIAFSFAELIAIWVPLVLYLIFVCVYPWVRWKSMRFFTANSTYRHIALSFRGSKADAYRCFLGMPLLAVATLGALAPWAIFKARKYFYGNLRYGNAVSEFRGRVGYFYKVCIFPILGMLLLLIILGTVPIVIGGYWSANQSNSLSAESGSPAATEETASGGGDEEAFDPEAFEEMMERLPVPMIMGMVIAVASFYLMMIFAVVIIRVLLLNYCWSKTRIQTDAGYIRFRSRLNPLRFMWILVTNFILTILTLGIYIPFAIVRIHRYRVDCLDVFASERLDAVKGLAPEEVGALGETASDWLDLEFGL